MKLLTELLFLNWIALVAGLLSIFFYWGFVIVFNFHFISMIFQPQIDNVYFRLFGDLKFWFALILLPLIALIPDITLKYFKMLYWPTPIDHALFKSKQADALRKQRKSHKIVKEKPKSKKKSDKDLIKNEENKSKFKFYLTL